MAYETLYFTGNRITPKKRFVLPGKKVRKFNSCSPEICRIVGGKVYAISPKDIAFRLSLDNLKEEFLWENSGEIGVEFFLASDDDIFFQVSDKTLRKFNVTSSYFFDFPLTDGFSSSPQNTSLQDGYLISGFDSKGFNALFYADKKLDAYRIIDKGLEFEEFSTDNKSKVVVYEKNGFIAYSVESGRKLWETPLEALEVEGWLDNIQSRVHIYKNTVIAATKNVFIVGLDLSMGNLVWKQQLKGDVNYPCVDWRGCVYKVSNENLIIISAESGEKLQEKPIVVHHLLDKEKPRLNTAFCDVTETHFFGVTPKGLLYAVNLETAEMEWFDDTAEMYQMGRPFVIHGNRLYFQTVMSDKLIVYEGRGGYQPDYG